MKAKATLIGKLASRPSAAPSGRYLEIYAPSLRHLPEGSMLVMATLPVVDWNDCLLRDLRTIHKRTSVRAYAAMVMIDPFACWEDLADSLNDAGIFGVINFPPASIIERSIAGVPLDAGKELELRRMEWFASLGFKALFVASNDLEITTAESRLGSHLDGIVYFPPEALTLTIGDDMELISLGSEDGSSVPKLALSDGIASKRRVRKN
ncbi:hypothetical protein [Bradyrhizobium sp. USDA 10063]